MSNPILYDGLGMPVKAGVNDTDVKMPPGSGKTLVIYHSELPAIAQLLKDNPDYFKDNSYQYVQIVSDKTYMEMVRNQRERQIHKPLIGSELVEDMKKRKIANMSLYQGDQTGEVYNALDIAKKLNEGKVEDIK
jgi:hypothetical protein